MDYFKLSSAQQRVILSMFTENYLMVNNDGKDFKVWLEDSTFTKRGKLNRQTGEYLHREGWVVSAEDVNRHKTRLFYNVISPRATKHLQFLISIGKLRLPK